MNNPPFEVEEPEATLTSESDTNIPSRYSPEWSDFALSHLTDKEKDENGNPKCDGLRRLVNLLIGPIAHSRVHTKSSTPDFVVTEYEVGVGRGDIVISYREVADVSRENTRLPYLNHPLATCATRTESRCLRKLLGLVGVQTAEESAMDTSQSDNQPVDDSQLNYMDMMGKRLDINVKKLVDKYKVEHNAPKIHHTQAAEVCSLLAGYMKGREEVPDEVKGYNANWRPKTR